MYKLKLIAWIHKPVIFPFSFSRMAFDHQGSPYQFFLKETIYPFLNLITDSIVIITIIDIITMVMTIITLIPTVMRTGIQIYGMR